MTTLVDKRVAMDARDIDRALGRMAHEIVERLHGAERVALVGIRTGGVPLARRLADRITRIEGGGPPPVGTVDIALYRDDVFRGLPQPVIGPTEIDFPLDDRHVVLVDDVLYTGRTVRAALDALMDFGRPRRVALAVLVDRGGRELPIRADFVGREIEARSDEDVVVRLSELHGEDRVVIRGMP